MSRRTLIVATALCLAIVAGGFLVLIHPRKSVPPILMYHSVTNEDDGPDPSIGLRLFRHQMAVLSTHGYETVFVKRVYVSKYSAIPLMFRFMLSGYYVPTRGLILRVLNIKAPRDAGCPATPGPSS